jgi:hypothetical protein
VDKNRDPLPYNKWDRGIQPNAYFAPNKPEHSRESIFPTGVGGILYPPKCLCEEATDKELFMKLAPYADDIWFWAMALINKEYFAGASPYIIIENGYSGKLYDVDTRQRHSGNALDNYNVRNNGNDAQLRAVIERYPQIKEILKRIEPTALAD